MADTSRSTALICENPSPTRSPCCCGHGGMFSVEWWTYSLFDGPKVKKMLLMLAETSSYQLVWVDLAWACSTFLLAWLAWTARRVLGAQAWYGATSKSAELANGMRWQDGGLALSPPLGDLRTSTMIRPPAKGCAEILPARSWKIWCHNRALRRYEYLATLIYGDVLLYHPKRLCEIFTNICWTWRLDEASHTLPNYYCCYYCQGGTGWLSH